MMTGWRASALQARHAPERAVDARPTTSVSSCLGCCSGGTLSTQIARLYEVFRLTEDAKVFYVPGKGEEVEHPARYEHDVQVMIQEMQPPLNKRFAVRLGEDLEGIGGVSVWEEVRQGEHYELCFAALALRLRGRRMGHADEMMADSLDGITSRCVPLRGNWPSHRGGAH